MRFIDTMPTLASVAPPVPPRMMINAPIFRNAAGLVPFIIELSASAQKATPIPIAVAAFIVPIHRPKRAFPQSTLISPQQTVHAHRVPIAGMALHGLGQNPHAPGTCSGGDLLWGLGDDDLRCGRERDDRVGGGLDAHDQVGVELERLVGMTEPV